MFINLLVEKMYVCMHACMQGAMFINLFVVAVFAHGFYDPGRDDGGEQLDIGLQTAGKYIGEMYGPAMVTIWALGLLAAGKGHGHHMGTRASRRLVRGGTRLTHRGRG